MDLLKWDENWSVKISIIDEQHKKLFSLLSWILEAIKLG